ncbi:MAG: hypothetical protein GXO32_06005 [Crenarchaeota archaeon]|nr:hypothetical protein [Thermoproteota archaeon]
MMSERLVVVFTGSAICSLRCLAPSSGMFRDLVIVDASGKTYVGRLLAFAALYSDQALPRYLGIDMVWHISIARRRSEEKLARRLRRLLRTIASERSSRIHVDWRNSLGKLLWRELTTFLRNWRIARAVPKNLDAVELLDSIAEEIALKASDYIFRAMKTLETFRARVPGYIATRNLDTLDQDPVLERVAHEINLLAHDALEHVELEEAITLTT